MTAAWNGGSGISTVAVIAKQPVPGRVKTRLIGPCSPEQAAELAACALADTLLALQDFPCEHRVVVLDGTAGGWLPAGWSVQSQSAGELDVRLSAGFDGLPAGPAVLVGMDTPQLQTGLLNFDPSRYDACLGEAEDGGFWAIGFADPRRARACIEGVPMSRSDTGAEQLRRLVGAGLSVQPLARLTDIDTAASAETVAAAAPSTSFARLWRELAPVPAGRR
jgi:glycosyltransferase A (GT-A) superfamily protein (DUF2064 family)